MKILFRSCGGLGNQIFQIFFARLMAEKYETKDIWHYHEPKYDRIARWEYPNSQSFKKPNDLEFILMRMRLPKILFRLGIINREFIKVGNYIILDGYFQSRTDYEIFNFEVIENQKSLIHQELRIKQADPALSQKMLYHVRLGDFFKTEVEQLRFIAGITNRLIADSYIISNRDDLFLKDDEFLSNCEKKSLKYVPTDHMNGLDLINFLSQFGTLISNGSSLSFASVIIFKQQINSFENIDHKSFSSESFKRLIELKNLLDSN